MSKWAEVQVQIIKVFAVEIEDTESIGDAEKYALDECVDGEAEIKESFIAKNDIEAKAMQRHADETL